MSRYHRNTDDTDESTTTTAELDDDDVHAALRDADEPLADAINEAVRGALGVEGQQPSSVDLDSDVHAALRDADEPLADMVNGAVRAGLADVDPESGDC